MCNTRGNVVKIYGFGGPEVLQFEKLFLEEPSEYEVRVQHYAIGLNFIDVNMRNGAYSINTYSPESKSPYILGVEGSGRVQLVGKKIKHLKVGDRVTHCMNLGTYSNFMNVKADKLISLPENISYEMAAASTLKGLTAYYLVKKLAKIKKLQTVLIHSAAGGVGSLLCQWAKLLGAKVIGVVSTAEKADYVKDIGADYCIISKKQDFLTETKKITNGEGANIIYDSVGKDTFKKGLRCLAKRGKIISYGNSSGPIEPIDISVLKPLSASIICGGLLTFIKDKVERQKNAIELFNLIKKGYLNIDINQRYSLKEISSAHKEIESRKTIGSSIIIP